MDQVTPLKFIQSHLIPSLTLRVLTLFFWRVELLNFVLLRIYRLPTSLPIRENIGEDTAVQLLSILIVGHDDSIYYGDVAIEADFQLVEMLFEICRRHPPARIVDVLGLGQEIAGGNWMNKIRLENTFQERRIVFALQPGVFQFN